MPRRAVGMGCGTAPGDLGAAEAAGDAVCPLGRQRQTRIMHPVRPSVEVAGAPPQLEVRLDAGRQKLVPRLLEIGPDRRPPENIAEKVIRIHIG